MGDKIWKLLSKEEIIALDQTDLEDYLDWLQTYKEKKIKELELKRITLARIEKQKTDKLIKEMTLKEEEEIEKIRKEIKSLE